MDSIPNLRADLSQLASRLTIVEEKLQDLVDLSLLINEELEAVHEYLDPEHKHGG